MASSIHYASCFVRRAVMYKGWMYGISMLGVASGIVARVSVLDDCGESVSLTGWLLLFMKVMR